MNQANIKTHQTLLFVANVGEEGNGDLNGVRYLFKEGPYHNRLREFISIDGDNPARIVNGGTGVKRYLVTLRGPGGHSYGDFGRPSPIHAAGRIIDRFADMEVPRAPKTTFNVGRIRGGTAINAIAQECSFGVDLCSEEPGTLVISLGIPAITLGGGGNGGNAHSLNEFYEPANGWKGPQTVLLTILEFDSRQR